MTEHVLNPLCFPPTQKAEGNSPCNLLKFLGKNKQKLNKTLKYNNLYVCILNYLSYLSQMH